MSNYRTIPAPWGNPRPGADFRRLFTGVTLVAATVWTGWARAQEGSEAIMLPSGMATSYLDTIQAAPGNEGLTIRFRFVAKAIADNPADEGTLADMQWLCETFALPRLPATGPAPEQVIITLASRAVTFGDADPEATQFFEAFRPEGDICVWEAF